MGLVQHHRNAEPDNAIPADFLVDSNGIVKCDFPFAVLSRSAARRDDPRRAPGQITAARLTLSASSSDLTAFPGDSAPKTAPITATPAGSEPSSRTRSAVIPPSAYTGIGGAAVNVAAPGAVHRADRRVACGAQRRDATRRSRADFRQRRIYRPEDGEIRAALDGGADFAVHVRRDPDQSPWPEQPARIRNRERVYRQMHPVGAARDGHVDPIVNQQLRVEARAELAHRKRERVQLAGREIFLTELNCDRAAMSRVVRGAERRLADRRQAAACGGLPAVGDQIELESDAGIHTAFPDRTLSLDARPIVQRITPVSGLDAVAYSFCSIRPAPHASRPASTASRIARAIAIGSRAPAIAVFISTPSHPSSIASAASEAVPTPASTITGTFACSRMIRRLYGLRIPRPEPIGAASGITATHPSSASLQARDRIVGDIRQDLEALLDENLRGFDRRRGIGEQRPVIADHFELHHLADADFARQAAGANRLVGGIASGRVGQNLVAFRVQIFEQIFFLANR